MAELDLAGAIVAAPVGAALLGLLERDAAHSVPRSDLDPGTDPSLVRGAARRVERMELSRLLELALSAADIVGPWHSTALDSVTAAYRDATARASIADAIAATFGPDLDQPLRLDAQEWWSDCEELDDHRWFERFDRTYGRGSFTFGGLWTVTRPPDRIHDELIHGSWDFIADPVRWGLPVRGAPRVLEVHRPEHWADLVARHPGVTRGLHDGWELPGLNQSPAGLMSLLAVPGQHAANGRDTFLAPDWASVVSEYDAVHLSWAGFLTAEGFVSELTGGGVAMLRYWGSERTLWLRDRFGDPQPLAPTSTNGEPPDLRRDAARAERSRSALLRSMGR